MHISVTSTAIILIKIYKVDPTDKQNKSISNNTAAVLMMRLNINVNESAKLQRLITNSTGLVVANSCRFMCIRAQQVSVIGTHGWVAHEVNIR